MDRWKETVVSVVNKIGELKYHSYTDKAYSLVFPFSKFDVFFDEKKIEIKEPLKTLGVHDVLVRVHPEITSTIKVNVVAE